VEATPHPLYLGATEKQTIDLIFSPLSGTFSAKLKLTLLYDFLLFALHHPTTFPSTYAKL